MHQRNLLVRRAGRGAQLHSHGHRSVQPTGKRHGGAPNTTFYFRATSVHIYMNGKPESREINPDRTPPSLPLLSPAHPLPVGLPLPETALLQRERAEPGNGLHLQPGSSPQHFGEHYDSMGFEAARSHWLAQGGGGANLLPGQLVRATSQCSHGQDGYISLFPSNISFPILQLLIPVPPVRLFLMVAGGARYRGAKSGRWI